MQRLTQELAEQFKRFGELEETIRKNLAGQEFKI